MQPFDGALESSTEATLASSFEYLQLGVSAATIAVSGLARFMLLLQFASAMTKMAAYNGKRGFCTRARQTCGY